MIFVCVFLKVNNLFLHQSYFKKPTPSLIDLIKNAKNHLLMKKLKNTEIAQIFFLCRLTYLIVVL